MLFLFSCTLNGFESFPLFLRPAPGVVKLVDISDLGSDAERHGSSSLPARTNQLFSKAGFLLEASGSLR